MKKIRTERLGEEVKAVGVELADGRVYRCVVSFCMVCSILSKLSRLLLC